mgnify:CR=1 FL=1
MNKPPKVFDCSFSSAIMGGPPSTGVEIPRESDRRGDPRGCSRGEFVLEVSAKGSHLEDRSLTRYR